MDLKIFIVLLVFMFLFLAGGVLTLQGFLTRKHKKLRAGLVLLALCLLFMIAMKYVKGLY